MTKHGVNFYTWVGKNHGSVSSKSSIELEKIFNKIIDINYNKTF